MFCIVPGEPTTAELDEIQASGAADLSALADEDMTQLEPSPDVARRGLHGDLELDIQPPGVKPRSESVTAQV